MKNKTKYLVIYHNEDADGLVSASIIFNNLIGFNTNNTNDIIKSNITNISNFLNCNIDIKQYNDDNVTVDLFGTYYSQLSTILNTYNINEFVDILYKKYDQIIMTDISFNETNVMKSLFNKFGINFTWFDHHAPIIKASISEDFNCIPGIRDIRTSAIGLTYSYFEYKDNNVLETFEDKIQNYMPIMLCQLAGYDSYNWEFHNQSFDSCYIMTRGFEYETNLDIIKCIIFIRDYFMNLYGYEENDVKDKIDNYYNKGKDIIEYEDNFWANMIKTSGDSSFVIDGKNGPERKTMVLFMSGKTRSIYFKSLIGTDIKNVAVFKKIPNVDIKDRKAKVWNISVYNVNIEDDKVFHVGNYLKKTYKTAGGHAGAGGSTVSNYQFNKIMKTHKI